MTNISTRSLTANSDDCYSPLIERLEDRVLLSATDMGYQPEQVTMEWQGEQVIAYKNSWVISAKEGSFTDKWLERLADTYENKKIWGTGSGYESVSDLGSGDFEVVTEQDLDAKQVKRFFGAYAGFESFGPNENVLSSNLATMLEGDFEDVVPLIVTGDPNGNPGTSPSQIIDSNTVASQYAGVGSWAFADDYPYWQPDMDNDPEQWGSGAVIGDGRHVLTAAHVFDTNNDGNVDVNLNDLSFYIHAGASSGVYGIDQVYLHEDFTGFNNPSVNDDIAVVRLDSFVSSNVPVYQLSTSPFTTSETITMVGYGTSGTGTGSVVASEYDVKRVGYNLAQVWGSDDEGSGSREIWYADFDGATPTNLNGFDGGTLGNAIEAAIAGGDSGGASFVTNGNGLELFGVNTFGTNPVVFGGYFGGMIVSTYAGWIYSKLNAPENLSLSNTSVNENASNGTTVGTVSVTDPDVGDQHTFELTNNAGGRFAIDSETGVLTVANGSLLDYESQTSHEVTVQVSDFGGLTTSENFTIDLNNVVPTLPAKERVTFAEHGTGVAYTVEGIDSGATLTYRKAGGADKDLFNLNSETGEITFITPPDYENSTDKTNNNIYVIRVQAYDQTGYSAKQTVEIQVTNVVPNLPAKERVNFAEQGTGPAYTVAGFDPGATLTYRKAGGADKNLFNLNSETGEITFIVPPDYENSTDKTNNNIYVIRVQAYDQTGYSAKQTVEVKVTNVAPQIGSNEPVYVSENVIDPVYTAVGIEPGATLTYHKAGGADMDLFNLNSETGEITFITAPDFESPMDFNGDNKYVIRVWAYDGNLYSAKQTISVFVTM